MAHSSRNYRQRQRGVYGTPQEATAEGAEEGDPDFNRWLKKKNGQISGGGGSNFSVRPGWRGGRRGGPTATARYRF